MRSIAIVLTSLGISALHAEEVDYLKQIKPVLQSKCVACHSVLRSKGELRLDYAGGVKAGGSSGELFVPGKSSESLLIEVLKGQSDLPRMPLDAEPLSEEQIELFRRWIDGGALTPEEEPPADPRSHWAYKRPIKQPIPAAEHPVDHFIEREFQKTGITPLGETDRRTWLRRVSLDLIGIPPTPEELAGFEGDTSENAYETVVDRLLASPHYGERWGRHWMDVWRYSDWDGYGMEVRESQPHIWRWRDWIIKSLNEDSGYDRMVVQMLAADESTPGNQDELAATGFLVRNWYKFNRNVWVDGTVEHTAKAFLGTTLNCARCHDHLYDPIGQEEYYRFRALFEPHQIRTDPLPGKMDSNSEGIVRAYDADLAVPTHFLIRGDEKSPDKDKNITPGLPAIFTRDSLPIEPVSLPATTYYPALDPVIGEGHIQLATQKISAAEKELAESEIRQKSAQAAASAMLGPVWLEESFEQISPEIWSTVEGDWSIAEGKSAETPNKRAVQSKPKVWARLISKKEHPSDLKVTLRFKVTGGDVWRSVGISFDTLDDKEATSVYLSAYGQGSKLQISIKKAGVDNYPPAGTVNRPVELDRDYELAVSIKGQLLNILVDGQPALAYRLTEPRPTQGKLSIWTYDATASFDALTVTELGEVQLAEKTNEIGDPKAQALAAERGVLVSKKKLQIARAESDSIVARLRADRTRLLDAAPSGLIELRQTASTAEKKTKLLQAELNTLQAEFALADAPQETEEQKMKFAELETNLKNAQEQVRIAQTGLETLDETYSPVGPVHGSTSSGRRLALARWIVGPENPLTARVAINHIWLRHFGSPLVPSVFDFGLNGKPPTHPELLDWLACELVENRWSMKHIHRLICTSHLYRRSSAFTGQHPAAQLDPENRLLWRMNIRRMESEIVRDATLAVSGALDRTQGGPDLDPQLGLNTPRRSVYFRNSKEKKVTFLALFDSPNVVECYRRSESIVPQQALAMANSQLSLVQSRVLAGKLSTEQPEFIHQAFETILGRLPTESEKLACEKFLEKQAKLFNDPSQLTQFKTGEDVPVQASPDPVQRARENLVHVLFNHNDFISIR